MPKLAIFYAKNLGPFVSDSSGLGKYAIRMAAFGHVNPNTVHELSLFTPKILTAI
jgi:hypothetical protein